jgi:hypothetical protein
VIEREAAPVIEHQRSQEPEQAAPPPELPAAAPIIRREIALHFHDQEWRVDLELSTDPAIGPWVDISDGPVVEPAAGGRTVRRVGIRLALSHPFTERFATPDVESIEPFVRLAVAVCLAEVTARDSGVTSAGTVRRNLNDLLRNALSRV